MDSARLQEQVELIRQVFEYTQRFKGSTFVFKIDCPIMDQATFPLLVKDLVLLHRQGIRIILVPGAKQRIDEILLRYEIEWNIVEGIRISTPDAIPFIKMAAFDVSNRLMTHLAESNAEGVIGNWVRARSIGVRQGVDYEFTGLVDRVDIDRIKTILDEGMIPILPNIGWNLNGTPYNISSDDLACTLGTALGAAKLFFISDVRGIQKNDYKTPTGLPVSEQGLIPYLSVDQAEQFLEQNQSPADKLLELVSLAHRACRNGVRRVHILDGRLEGGVLKEIFSSRGSGTMIFANEHENIRPLVLGDVADALRIMQPYVEADVLIHRSEQELKDNLADFVVYEVDGILHACGALHSYDGGLGEIAALAVDQTYSGWKIGSKIISYLLSKAKSLALNKVFVLTTQSSDWFFQFGFAEGGVDDLPREKQTHYNKCRNSRVLVLKAGDFDLSMDRR